MAVRPVRRPSSSGPTTAQLPNTIGPFNGMAQDGPARKTRPSVLAEEILTRGCKFVEKGIWDDAEKEFRKAIKMAPDYPEAYNNLGLCMIFDGRPAEAREALQEALKQFPGWASAEANLAFAYQQLDNHEEAASYFKQSLNHNTKQPQVCLSLGDVLNTLGRSDDAVAAYQKAIEQVPHFALAHSRIGLIYARKGKINEAENALSRAVQLDPTSAEAMSVLGAISARRGNFRQAKEWFGKIAAESVPVAAQRGAQRIELFENAVRKGFEEWKTMQPAAKPLAECYFNLALALLTEGNQNEAQGMFQRAAQQNPEWFAPQLFLAFGSAAEGNALMAKTAFDNAARLDAQNGIVPEQLGYLALGMGMLKEADVQFKKAQELGRVLPPNVVQVEGGA